MVKKILLLMTKLVLGLVLIFVLVILSFVVKWFLMDEWNISVYKSADLMICVPKTVSNLREALHEEGLTVETITNSSEGFGNSKILVNSKGEAKGPINSWGIFWDLGYSSSSGDYAVFLKKTKAGFEVLRIVPLEWYSSHVIKLVKRLSKGDLDADIKTAIELSSLFIYGHEYWMDDQSQMEESFFLDYLDMVLKRRGFYRAVDFRVFRSESMGELIVAFGYLPAQESKYRLVVGDKQMDLYNDYIVGHGVDPPPTKTELYKTYRIHRPSQLR